MLQKPSRRWLAAILVAGAVWLAVAADLAQPTWEDENYSRWMFIEAGPRAILNDYHLPNNHVLFNLARWAFGIDTWYQRLLPFAFSVLALLGVGCTVARHANLYAAAVAVAIFATSHTVASFGAQLRGYSLSLACIAWALFFAQHWMASRFEARWPAYGLLVVSAGAIATIPTNLLFVVGTFGWMFLSPPHVRRHEALRIAALGSAASVVGACVYVGMWRQVLDAARALNPPALDDLLGALFIDLLAVDLWMIYPVAVAIGWWRMYRHAELRPWLALSAIGVGICFIPLVGGLSHDRTFMPIVVIMCVGIAPLATAVVHKHTRIDRLQCTAWLVAAIFLGALVRPYGLEHAKDASWARDQRPHSLLTQYYRESDFDPSEARSVLSSAGSNTLIITTNSTAWDVAPFFRSEALRTSGCIVMLTADPFCAFKDDPQSIDELWVLHWSHSGAERIAKKMARHLGTTLESAEVLLLRRRGFVVLRYAMTRP